MAKSPIKPTVDSLVVNRNKRRVAQLNRDDPDRHAKNAKAFVDNLNKQAKAGTPTK